MTLVPPPVRDARALLRSLEHVTRRIGSLARADDVFALVLATAEEAVGCESASFMILEPAG
ncbi:MAG: hypothetical protein ACRDF0_06595, partial [Candidatus Limnocylindria bacterium]